MESNKIQLVVVNENTLGYIFPEYKQTIHVLHASVLKGAHGGNGSSLQVFMANSIRLASEKDFNDYRVCFDGYKNNKNEYEYQS